jgi:hypothetical protein
MRYPWTITYFGLTSLLGWLIAGWVGVLVALPVGFALLLWYAERGLR